MKVIDKEQERQEFEQTEEGKQKKKKEKIQHIVILVLSIICLVGLFGWNRMNAGKPFEVMIGDTTIIPGKTTVKELMNDGFYFTYLSGGSEGIIDKTARIDGNTYVPNVFMRKEKYGDELVAFLKIMNEEKEKKSVEDCTVAEIAIYDDIEEIAKEYNFTVSVADMPFGEQTLEALKKQYGKHVKEHSDWYSVEYDKYSLDIKTEDGYSISSKYHYNER